MAKFGNVIIPDKIAGGGTVQRAFLNSRGDKQLCSFIVTITTTNFWSILHPDAHAPMVRIIPMDKRFMVKMGLKGGGHPGDMSRAGESCCCSSSVHTVCM